MAEKPRKNFYANELNMTRVEEVLNDVASKLTLKEALKMIREITYDQVCYYDKDAKGIVYNGEYSREDIENATFVQKVIRDSCDFFNQIVVEHHSFNQDYIQSAFEYGFTTSKVRALEEKIKKLEQENQNLKEELNRVSIIIK